VSPIPPMEYRPLGRTGLSVSVASLGTGGQSRLGQATHGDPRESERVVRRALELGINLIDTAPNYADTEELLGTILGGVPRGSYLVTTKALVNTPNGPVAPEDVSASCERSLRRLQTDYVDGLLFHNVGPGDYDRVSELLYPVAERLKQQGKVRFVGLTERQEGRTGTSPIPGGGDPGHLALARALEDEIWDAVGLKYGILNQAADREVLPRALAKQVGMLNMSSVRIMLARPDRLEGLLAEWAAKGLLNQGTLPAQNPLGFLVQGEVGSVTAAAYKFAAAPEAISTVVIGTGSVAHLEENVAAILGPGLPAADQERLRALFGHLAEGV
jgi:aryl-alcohol dehydrogenase-like predicted oxidoreductase